MKNSELPHVASDLDALILIDPFGAQGVDLSEDQTNAFCSTQCEALMIITQLLLVKKPRSVKLAIPNHHPKQG